MPSSRTLLFSKCFKKARSSFELIYFELKSWLGSSSIIMMNFCFLILLIYMSKQCSQRPYFQSYWVRARSQLGIKFKFLLYNSCQTENEVAPSMTKNTTSYFQLFMKSHYDPISESSSKCNGCHHRMCPEGWYERLRPLNRTLGCPWSSGKTHFKESKHQVGVKLSNCIQSNSVITNILGTGWFCSL